MTKGDSISMKPVSEQTVFITGATDGLGKMMAGRLAKKRARVLLHGRNQTKGRLVIEELKKASGNDKLEYFNADFSSPKNIAALGEELRSGCTHLDILINNAGIGGGSKSSPLREYP